MQDGQVGQKGQEGPIDFVLGTFGPSGRYVYLHPPFYPLVLFIFLFVNFVLLFVSLYGLFV